MKNEGEIKPFIWKEKFNIKVEKADAFPPPYIDPKFRLLIYLYIILVSGNVYMGWTGFQELLYKAGSFEDLCDASTLEYIDIRSNSIIDCPDRKAAINNLYSYAFATNILFCIISGLILDFFGHKITFMIGQFINFLCWIFIGIYPKNGLLIKIIMVIIGLTSETLYLPLTTVALYFPDHKSTMISILGSVRTLSFFVTSVLSFIYLKPNVKRESFITVATIFAFVVYFGCFLIGSFIIQMNFFEKPEDKELEHTKNNPKESKTIHQLYHTSIILMGKLVKDPKFLQTILFTIAASLHMACVEFLNMSQRELLITNRGDSVVNMFRYVQILTFLPGIFMGIIVDKFGTAETMIVLQICLLFSYVMVGFDQYYTKLVGCWLYFIGGALYLTIIYCYIYENFNPKRVGIVLGFVLLVCGGLVLLNIPLYNLGLKFAKSSRFSNISWVLVGFMGLSITATTGVIYIKTRIKSRNCRKVDDNKN